MKYRVAVAYHHSLKDILSASACQQDGLIKIDLELEESDSIGDIKKKILDRLSLTGDSVSSPMLVTIIFNDTIEEENSRNILNCLSNTGNPIIAAIVPKISVIPLKSLGCRKSNRPLVSLVANVIDGLKYSKCPTLTPYGSGGTYFMPDSLGNRVACFKPCDEEPSAANNPRKRIEASTREGVLPCEAALREVAAFIIDKDGLMGVPATSLVEIACPQFHYPEPLKGIFAKRGSLQRYVRADSASDFSPYLFPVHEVQKVGILDILLLNCDRNDSNLLVSRQRKRNELFAGTRPSSLSCCYQSSPDAFDSFGFDDDCGFETYSQACPTDFDYFLTPIDHGYCLPDTLLINWCDLCWLDWPQTHVPFTDEIKKWIENQDFNEIIKTLRDELQIREPCLALMSIAGRLLKLGVNNGLSLHQIASIVVRQKLGVPSILENEIVLAADRSKQLCNKKSKWREKSSRYQTQKRCTGSLKTLESQSIASKVEFKSSHCVVNLEQKSSIIEDHGCGSKVNEYLLLEVMGRQNWEECIEYHLKKLVSRMKWCQGFASPLCLRNNTPSLESHFYAATAIVVDDTSIYTDDIILQRFYGEEIRQSSADKESGFCFQTSTDSSISDVLPGTAAMRVGPS